jgi:hypothetical protein
VWCVWRLWLGCDRKQNAFFVCIIRLIKSLRTLVHCTEAHQASAFYSSPQSLSLPEYCVLPTRLIFRHTRYFPLITHTDVLKKQLEALNNELDGVKDKLEVRCHW